MFGLFSNKESKCPVDEEMRQWIEYAMQWLLTEFEFNGDKKHKSYSTMQELLSEAGIKTATLDDISIIISKIMDIDNSKIELFVYEEGQVKMDTVNSFIGIQTDENSQLTAGQYHGINEDGKFEVHIEHKLLKDPIGLVSVIAHEFAHIKLLGEDRIKENDELLTDMLPIIYGLGVFGANACYGFTSNFEGWGHNSSGYLTQMDWGYALAVYAWLQKETEENWIESLPGNIKSDYKQSIRFMKENEEILFKDEQSAE